MIVFFGYNRFHSKPVYLQRLEFIDSAEPIDVAFLKAQCRIDNSVEDTLLALYIAAAREKCELELRAKVRQQSVKAYFTSFGCGLRLNGIGPLSSVGDVTSIEYTDTTGALQVLDPTVYSLQQSVIPVLIAARGKDWPALPAVDPSVEVTVTAGYANVDAVPEPIKLWIAAEAASMFRSRESQTDKQMTRLDFIDGLLDPFRKPAD